MMTPSPYSQRKEKIMYKKKSLLDGYLLGVFGAGFLLSSQPQQAKAQALQPLGLQQGHPNQSVCLSICLDHHPYLGCQ